MNQDGVPELAVGSHGEDDEQWGETNVGGVWILYLNRNGEVSLCVLFWVERGEGNNRHCLEQTNKKVFHQVYVFFFFLFKFEAERNDY